MLMRHFPLKNCLVRATTFLKIFLLWKEQVIKKMDVKVDFLGNNRGTYSDRNCCLRSLRMQNSEPVYTLSVFHRKPLNCLQILTHSSEQCNVVDCVIFFAKLGNSLDCDLRYKIVGKVILEVIAIFLFCFIGTWWHCEVFVVNWSIFCAKLLE